MRSATFDDKPEGPECAERKLETMATEVSLRLLLTL